MRTSSLAISYVRPHLPLQRYGQASVNEEPTLCMTIQMKMRLSMTHSARTYRYLVDATPRARDQDATKNLLCPQGSPNQISATPGSSKFQCNSTAAFSSASSQGLASDRSAKQISSWPIQPMSCRNGRKTHTFPKHSMNFTTSLKTSQQQPRPGEL